MDDSLRTYEWPGNCEGEKTGYSHLAPKFTSDPEKINQPLGIRKARRIAAELGITPEMTFTKEEYREFLGTKRSRRTNTNQAIIYNCVQVLSNSSANPIKVDTDGDKIPDEKIILGSYGLSVINNNSQAYIQTDCYETSCGYEANCLQFNSLATGYLQRWSIEHGTYKKWREMIKLRSFKKLTYASINCQNDYVEDNACIVNLKGPETDSYAGVPLAPTLWLINFMFLYKMNPKVAAKMPGYAAHIPTDFAEAMIEAQADESYGLSYSEYINTLPGTTSIPIGNDEKITLRFDNNDGRIHNESIKTNDGNDKVIFSKNSPPKLTGFNHFDLGGGDDAITFSKKQFLKGTTRVSLGTGVDVLTAPSNPKKVKGQLIIEDFEAHDVLRFGDVTYTGTELDTSNLPSFIVVNPASTMESSTALL